MFEKWPLFGYKIYRNLENRSVNLLNFAIDNMLNLI